MKATMSGLTTAIPPAVLTLLLALALLFAASLSVASAEDPVNQVFAHFDIQQAYSTDEDSVSNTTLEGHTSLTSNLANLPDGTGAAVTGASSQGGPMLGLESTVTVVHVWQDYLVSGTVPGTSFTWGLPTIMEDSSVGQWVSLEETVSFTPGFAVSRSADVTTFDSTGGVQHVTLTVTSEESIEYLRVNGVAWVGGSNHTASLLSVEWVGEPPASYDLTFDTGNFWSGMTNPEVGTTYTLLATFQVASTIPGVEITYMPFLLISNEHLVAEAETPVLGSSLTHTAGAGTWTWEAEGTYLWDWDEWTSKCVNLQGYASSAVNQVDAMFLVKQDYDTPEDSVANTTLEGHASLTSNLGNLPDGTGAAVTGASSQGGPIVDLESSVTVTAVREDNLTSGLVPGTEFTWDLPAVAEGSRTACWGNLEGTVSFTPGFAVARSADVTTFDLAGATQHLTLTLSSEEAMAHLNVFGDVAVQGENYTASLLGVEWVGDPPPSYTLNLDAQSFHCYTNNPQVDVTYTLLITTQVASTLPGANVEFMPNLSASSVQPVANSETPVSGSSLTYTAGAGTWTWQAEGDYLWNWSEAAIKIVNLNGYAVTIYVAPDPPAGLVASDYPLDNGEALSLSWEASEGAVGYLLSRGSSPDPEEHDYEVDLGNLLSYVDTGLTPGQTYYYAVRAYDADGNLSEFSSVVACAPEDNGTETEAGWVSAGTGTTVDVGDVSMTFEEVTVPGSLTVTPETPSGQAPPGFRLLDQGWSVAPGTLVFAGDISIGFRYDSGTLPPGVQEGDLTIWHYEEGSGWQDVTDWVDESNDVIWARVTSFSAFALMAPANQAPVVETIVAVPQLVPLGDAVTLTGNFTDSDENDVHAATWQWDSDDPATESGTVTEVTSTTGQVADAHTYDEPGVYEVVLRVTDAAGDEASLSYHYVVVYDPEGGFVTGGGWIDSPPGAYVADTTLTGKANFGFVSKYKKGANTPTGSTEFQFKVADLNFKSTSYDWLVVAGAKAMYKGTGTINGTGEYGFLLSAVDAALTPSTSVDLFRIKIWDKDTGEVIYDNQMGEADDADAATAIGGGSIVVHK